MKNITLSADEDLIDRARVVAQSQSKTLNGMFREWLDQIAATAGAGQNYDALMKRLRHVSTGGVKFSRDEMNER